MRRPVAHMGPEDGRASAQCCGRHLIELPDDDMITNKPEHVTCLGRRDPRTGRYWARFSGAPWMLEDRACR